MGWEAGVATAPTESRRLLRVVHVLEREGKDQGWRACWTPSQQCLLRAHQEGKKGVTESHGMGHYESTHHRGEDTAHPRREVKGDALTCYTHAPPLKHHLALTTGWKFDQDTPKNRAKK